MTDVLSVIPETEPDPADFPSRVKLVAERVREFMVVTAEDYKYGTEALRRIKRQRQFLDSVHRPSIRAAKTAHEEAIKAFRTLDSLLEVAFDTVKERCEKWQQDQLAEQKRQLDAMKVTVSAPAIAAESDKQLAQAFDAAVESGDTAKAAHLLNQAAMPPVMQAILPPAPPPVTAFVPKVEGISSSTNWTYDVVDESIVPREYMTLDKKKVAAVVKAMKGDTRIPGIVARPDIGLRVRG